ncbi:40S ribosomal protein S13 [Spraguea lophii 42_110]|uniref:40S ribosomal protein S13 n=1 Tax=Spraguea lophii (strain 42_110) TaxID=1358809 RepID=S7XVZ9_SPRLO|nr:Chain SN0, 40S ribosomal protein S13 [Spraguea lophii 42_110]7QJH_RN0 Chain RN0, 40S ribosomal protein S13 [Spraguea lophii 42_110]7QJH_SN0 Chain SN0, 40S ribosomal protein S13 [Spraguea lophii 42_110]8BR3_SN0 Chain SN0, 40S ribosomal protein S13 [Spraguea lophii 42_110]8P5D_SN0 Chain SN0, 40S ribosomal protein S13 [Spraguea lophii 42_110]8P60_RN0 Chain RN0, 40S ribosomal protein S13 [Spraguea lophii 42_110]8P60_SN0 Chain SN0, 40S ribosomal protein S13 [Spraguea lophii 42_110]EPR80058.1 4
MARMYSNGKGQSKSVTPYNLTYPTYIKHSKEEIVDVILNLARKGTPPSQIGNILRDNYGVGKSFAVTKTKILTLLKIAGLKPVIPEDLNNIVKKCVNIKAHLAKYTNDKSSKYQLIQMQSCLYRVARYYKSKNELPAGWKPPF